MTRTPGTGGGGSSASLRASSVGGGGATVPVAIGAEPIDLALGLPLPLDRGLPGGGGREDGAGDTLFSFSSWCAGDFRTLRSRGAEPGGDVDDATTDAGVVGLFAARRTGGGSTTVFCAVVARPLVIG